MQLSDTDLQIATCIANQIISFFVLLKLLTNILCILPSLLYSYQSCFVILCCLMSILGWQRSDIHIISVQIFLVYHHPQKSKHINVITVDKNNYITTTNFIHAHATYKQLLIYFITQYSSKQHYMCFQGQSLNIIIYILAWNPFYELLMHK